MNSEELKSIGVSTGLILLSIGIMAAVALTPLSNITGLLFTVPIIGMVIFGAGITAGRWLARKGIKQNNKGLAVAGTGLLQISYGIFGGGILAYVPSNIFPVILGITTVITTGIAIGAALLVYVSGRSFRSWGRYSNYVFLAALVAGLIGSGFRPVMTLTFILVLIGFLIYLVYEIWNMKKNPRNIYMNGLGIYVAYMGVFVHILQMVLRYFLEE